MARSCPFCISTATRFWPNRAGRAKATRCAPIALWVMATMSISSRAMIRWRCTSDFAETLERCYHRSARYQNSARQVGFTERPRWPVIILRTPKGWTGPHRGGWHHRRGNIPCPPGAGRRCQEQSGTSENSGGVDAQLSAGSRSSTRDGRLTSRTGRSLRHRASGAWEPIPMPTAANCWLIWRSRLYRTTPLRSKQPATEHHESTRQLGKLLRESVLRNAEQRNFRLFCPDETNSNRLGDVFEVENRCLVEDHCPTDDHISPDGRVMEVLSEHLCQGWLEGYLLTGRHGLFATYEAFAMVSASMTVQHAKWLQEASQAGLARARSLRSIFC